MHCQEASAHGGDDEEKAGILQEIQGQWHNIMFSDESTFRLVRGGSKIVRRPSDMSRYNPQYTIRTVKQPNSLMVWGAFSGKMGKGGVYFLHKNVTMKSSTVIEC
ncbi:Transposable element Tcb2 transposase [Portunus trituberculatus]|uniref:Transposable element Tcb2 transposase n=1 Tax=Portunus trituberculatus TaxID=210409 RepID=A0A5B7K257_PORTR|nr:Transposable element Tcb2 transposase [Portunus trituberculatus]